MRLTRRHVLLGSTVALTALAGCQDNRGQPPAELGDDMADAPNVSFEFEFADGGGGRIVHEGGDRIGGPGTLFVHIGKDWREEWDDYPVGVADEFDLGRYPPDSWSGEEVEVVWEAPDQDMSTILGEATAPG